MSLILNSYESQPFKMTIAVVTPVTFVLPIASGGSVYNGTIFWGDGTSSAVTAAGNYSKTYASTGNYTIRIIGLFHGIYFNNTGTSKDLVTSISGMERLKALVSSFSGCRLTSVGRTIRPGITNISTAWRDNQLTSWTVPIPNSVVNIFYTWANNQLTSWTVPIPNSVTNIYAAWYNNQLTSWTVPIPNSVTNISYAWFNNRLTSWTVPIPNSVTSISTAWYNNRLTSWTVPIPSNVVDISTAWSNNTTLTTFATNIFDGCNCTNFTNAFQNTALTQSSIDNILVSINSNNTSNGTFNQSGGSAPSATGQAAITAMRSRGWTITVTGGF